VVDSNFEVTFAGFFAIKVAKVPNLGYFNVIWLVISELDVYELQGPLAVKVAKHAIDYGTEMDPSKGMLFEEACYSRLLRSTDRFEGLAAFAEKRKPVYKGE
jgi:enoyl-CoA hydratase/carnithine racemase